MPLLSRPAMKSERPRRTATPEASIGIVDDCVEAVLGGTIVVALPEGALWIEAARALVVADLHLEKGSSFARHGQMIPPYDTHEALTRLAACVEKHEPDMIVSLGDAFHDGGGPGRMARRDQDLLRSLMARCEWVWIEGNHDGKSPETIGGVVRNTLLIAGLTLRHDPAKRAAPGEISGHMHPCAKVQGGGRSVRRRCFAFDGTRMVMPAFGAYTGGLNICDPAFEPIFPNGAIAFVLSRDRVLPVPVARLCADY